MDFPEQQIGLETPASKIWRWWTAGGWSANPNDAYESLIVMSGGQLDIHIFFDRSSLEKVDVFQIWVLNLESYGWPFLWGFFDVYVNGAYLETQPVEAGPGIRINVDESNLQGTDHVDFSLVYYGLPVFVKSLELYCVMV